MKNIQTLLNPLLVFIMSIGVVSVAIAEQIAPPPVQVIDKLGVDITSAQVNTSLDTVSIGGTLGISHSISTHYNSYVTIHPYSLDVTGPNDKFAGRARLTQTLKPADVLESTAPTVNFYPFFETGETYTSRDYKYLDNGIWVMRVNSGTESVDFKVKRIPNGNIYYSNYVEVNNIAIPLGSYYYQAVKDKRHTLQNASELSNEQQPIWYASLSSAEKQAQQYLVWTKPDGTQIWYSATDSESNALGIVYKIVSPNGFTTTVHSKSFDVPLSVTTNTGFQLKYNYVIPTDDPFVASTQVLVPSANPVAWAIENPKEVVAINNAIESCNSDTIAPCGSLTKPWLSAKFEWPRGMPRALFTAESVFKVWSGNNALTEYKIKPIPRSVDQNGVVMVANDEANTNPRLVNIKSRSRGINTTYSYVNYFNVNHANMFFISYVPATSGFLSGASSLTAASGYGLPEHGNSEVQGSGNPNAYTYGGRSQGELTVVQRMDIMGIVENIKTESAITPEKEAKFELNLRNFVMTLKSIDGPSQDFTYDARNNLSKVTYNLGGIKQTTKEAFYPITCTNPKTCNQAEWIKDANGNTTYYTYHEPSGQIASVTLPANGQGISAKTRYAYQQKSATFFNAAGNRSVSSEPIWLKTTEKTCLNGNTQGDTCELGESDEITTAYEYDSDNLFLTGVTVKAANAKGEVKILRTCYRYDIYGNQIGKTQPKANLASCN